MQSTVAIRQTAIIIANAFFILFLLCYADRTILLLYSSMPGVTNLLQTSGEIKRFHRDFSLFKFFQSIGERRKTAAQYTVHMCDCHSVIGHGYGGILGASGSV
jgi:hypothetical protein